ncbi:glycine--tRNA ligase subunit beta [Agaribacterium sp. ZY112]|uniref:glycine--tRNA ligase subunit beta n=1 Tax=Agaribacterium sp. ZY112 TaxID=3233574 RepID=UPI00352500B3
MSSNYLFELGTEELPPKSLSTLSQALCKGVEQGLKVLGLHFESFEPFASPRRLAFIIKGLDEQTPITELEQFGPPAKVGFDAEGKPTKAALAFCQRNGVAIEDITVASDGKVDKLLCKVKKGGELTDALLPTIIEKALAELPIAKRMRWGASRTEFVRPVQWLVFLKDSDIVDCNLLGAQAGRITRGHRFLGQAKIELADVNSYQNALLEQGKVVADFNARRSMIQQQVQEVAVEINGTAVIDSDLLDEVTGLVEWPVALSGSFDKEFLQVPAEALISSMKEHQKYFHVVNDNNELLPYFITISNIESDDYSAIKQGNEKVIRPRLADAAFFFETDKKSSLESRREKLKTVVFQAKLGSIFDKTERIKHLSIFIAKQLKLESNDAVRAAELCKSDLVSAMVYEFPELQGIAGYHYALNDAENQEVATAINEHYLPKFAGDKLPSTNTAAIVALADRIDTIVGIFGIGQIPTGSKDPFALRRASVAVLRLLVELEFSLDLKALLEQAAKQFNNITDQQAVVTEVQNYIIERFKAWYEEAGIAAEVFQAVSVKDLSVPLDIHRRVLAVSEFSKGDDAEALAAANKRVANILAKLDSDAPTTVDSELLQEQAEIDLHAALTDLKSKVESELADSAYQDALATLSSLRNSVDAFFDQVMVMCDDEKLKLNRLSLLNILRQRFLEVADISLLAVKR